MRAVKVLGIKVEEVFEPFLSQASHRRDVHVPIAGVGGEDAVPVRLRLACEYAQERPTVESLWRLAPRDFDPRRQQIDPLERELNFRI